MHYYNLNIKICTSVDISLSCSLVRLGLSALSAIKKKALIHVCLPEIQSVKLCIRLQFACHIRTCLQVKFPGDPDATFGSRICELQSQAGKSVYVQGRRAGNQSNPEPPAGSPHNLSKNLKTIFLFPLYIKSRIKQSQCTDLELNPNQPLRMRSPDHSYNVFQCAEVRTWLSQ